MLRRLILSALGCAIVGVFSCSDDPAPPNAAATPTMDGESEMELPPGQSLARSAGDTMATPEETPTEMPIPVAAESIPEHPDASPTDPETPASAQSLVVTDPANVSTDADSVTAKAVLETMVAFYAGLNGFRVKSELSTRISDSRGLLLPNSSAPPQIREVIVQRPNRFAVRPETASLPMVVSEGTQLSALLPTRSRYLSLPAPMTFAELVAATELQNLIGSGPTQMIPFHLLSDDSGPLPPDLVSTAAHAGVESLAGAPTHKLTFSGAGTLVWDLWVAAEGDPLLLRASVNRGTRTMRIPGRGEAQIAVVIVETLSGWELDPGLTEDDFAMSIPEGAQEVADVAELLSTDDDADE